VTWWRGASSFLSVVPSSATTFIAVAFETVPAAQGALREVHERDLAVRDAAVVVRTEAGRIELEQGHEMAAGDTLVGGGTVGLVAGLLLGLPVGGALLGLAGGLLYGLRDRGLPDNRLRALGEDLEPGHAVLCVLVDAEDIPHAREALARYGAVFEVELSSSSTADADPDPGSGSGSGSGSAP
jgi:uncharacterized membrane protein